MKISTVINGKPCESDVPDNTLLLDWLRNDLELTGTKQSCEVQVCGVCTVLVDGEPVSACNMLAVEVRNSSITTIEGLRETDFFKRAEAIFLRHAAVQCGFCSPGFMLTVFRLASGGREMSMSEVRDSLHGNLCRCTGYKSIIEAAFEVINSELNRKPK